MSEKCFCHLNGIAVKDATARRILKNCGTPEMYGAVGDGVTDDTQAIQSALDKHSVVLLNGMYLVNIDTMITIPSNRTIYFRNATLKATMSERGIAPLEYTSIFEIKNVENISIIGDNHSMLFGDRENHEGTTHQFGFGIYIGSESTNISISGLILKNFTGDGIILDSTNITDVKIDNIVCDNNHRQGISICGGENINIENSVFKNTNGTPPQAGIDIEPYGENICSNIRIFNCDFLNNVGYGIDSALATGTVIKDITIDSCRVKNNGNCGINYNCIKEGKNTISNCLIENNGMGLRIVGKNLTANNNTVVNNSSEGIYLNSTQNVRVMDNISEKNKSCGIAMDSGCNTIIIRNRVNNNGNAGIYTTSGTDKTSEYNIIGENVIYSNNQNGGDSSGMQITNRFCNSIIRNNVDVISSDEMYSLYLKNGSTGNLITGNILTTKQTNVIHNVDGNTLINNIFNNAIYPAVNE